MDYNHHHQQQPPHGGYMRPPQPPPPPDPYQRPPPPPPSHHHQQQWPPAYSTANQFQYQTQAQHTPPPPQWPPYPPPPPPPHVPRPPHLPQSYSQEWGSGSWTHHQSWEYSTNNNEEDWAAKARAWAAAKAATDNQQPPSQFAPVGRPEEQNHLRDQYSQSHQPNFHDMHSQLATTSNIQQHPVGMGLPNRTGQGQLQDSQYPGSGQPSYAADMQAPYAARDGSIVGDPIAPFPNQEKSSMNSFVHQQEVPSSYSSIAGSQDARDRYENFNSSSFLSFTSNTQHPVQPPPAAGGRSGWMEEPHQFSQPAASVTALSDQPLNFAPPFNRELDLHAQSNYTHSSGGPMRGLDPTVAISSNHAWAPSSAPGAVYPPVPPPVPSGAQVDHSLAMPSQAPGHSAPLFPTGPGFQPSVPMVGTSFGVGPGVVPHPTAFPGDAYGVPGAFERPKKVSVPNWLREEIIKNKAVITSSAPEVQKEDSQSLEEDNTDKSSRKGYQADSRSVDSPRSTEEEDEDEDEVEAARTAAINQEIKRVLTEVLLKVTDELFDEIATKVLKEEDLSMEVGHDIDLSNHQGVPSTRSTLTPKASAKVLIPSKAKESDHDNASEKSTSGALGDILGLGSYASDEDDEEIQSSGKHKLKESPSNQQSSSTKPLKRNPVNDNGGSQEETEERINNPATLGIDGNDGEGPIISTTNRNDARATKKLVSIDDGHSSERLTGVEEDESRARITGRRSGKNDRHENKESLVGRDLKDFESAKERLDKKRDEEHGRKEERHARTEREENHSNSKDKGKEKGKSVEKVKNSESRKRQSPSDGKEGTSETGRVERSSHREDNGERRRDRTADEKTECSKHKNGSDSSRHRRRRSSSAGARGGESKNDSLVSSANVSSDEPSDDSRRKSRHVKRHRSPSPSRHRKRQVSRSPPHSKHSKRRHSPYSSSLETTRGRRSASRSRSRSPVHRRRQ